MKYNNATFWPITNTEQWDINSINANFKLAEWEWSNVEQTESLLSFWTPYEMATEYSTKATLEAALATPRAYHEGIIYSGLTVDYEKDYLTVDLPGSETIKVKPGSIIYTVDLSKELSDPTRYLIIESPVKYGYNYTIVNGLLTFSWGVLNTWTRPIKGPTGASNWNATFTFQDLASYKTDSNLLSFRIPINKIAEKNPSHPFTYSNAYTLLFYKTSESPINEISIPHKSWIAFEEDSLNHSYIYYLYIEFDITAGTAWGSHFISAGSGADPYTLLIW